MGQRAREKRKERRGGGLLNRKGVVHELEVVIQLVVRRDDDPCGGVCASRFRHCGHPEPTERRESRQVSRPWLLETRQQKVPCLST